MPASTIWLRPERAARGPAPEHSRTRLADAAIAVADARGLQDVTMRSVAAALGTAPASLYRYVSTRDELLELMIDRTVGECRYERLGSGDWRTDLLALAEETRALLLRHPWMVEAQGAGSHVGPNSATYLEHGLAALQTVQLSGQEKLEALAILSAVVRMLVGAEIAEASAAAGAAGTQAAAGAYLAHVVAQGEHPHLTAALTDTRSAPDDLFGRVVLRVLTGLVGDAP